MIDTTCLEGTGVWLWDLQMEVKRLVLAEELGVESQAVFAHHNIARLAALVDNDEAFFRLLGQIGEAEDYGVFQHCKSFLDLNQVMHEQC